MPDSLTFVQSPDYVGFHDVNLPLKALGVVYDGLDPYATPLGVVFIVRESGGVREVYVPRASRVESGRVIYSHDLGNARYIVARNGFESMHVRMGDKAISDESKNMLRAFFGAQIISAENNRFFLEVHG